jgi:RNA polymerase sigma-70 factor (ECF subfamily)
MKWTMRSSARPSKKAAKPTEAGSTSPRRASKSGKARGAGPPRAAAKPGPGKSGRPLEEARFGEREREYVFSVAMKYVKDEDEAADVAQDAMLLAYRHRASFRGDSRYTTWLYRVAATTALMHLRKKRRMPKELTQVMTDEGDDRAAHDALNEVPSPAASPEDAVLVHEAVAVARTQLDAMGDKYGPVFMMRFMGGYSEAEIARELKLNVGTVKTRAYRARTAVRSHLESALAA